MLLRRAAPLILPAVLLAATPALANRGRRPHGARIHSAGQVITRGGTSPAANLARARGARALAEQQAAQQAARSTPQAAQRRGTSTRADRERILRQQLMQHRDMTGGLDRRSKIALFVGVPVITGWILAMSQYGHAILSLFAG